MHTVVVIDLVKPPVRLVQQSDAFLGRTNRCSGGCTGARHRLHCSAWHGCARRRRYGLVGCTFGGRRDRRPSDRRGGRGAGAPATGAVAVAGVPVPGVVAAAGVPVPGDVAVAGVEVPEVAAAAGAPATGVVAAGADNPTTGLVPAGAGAVAAGLVRGAAVASCGAFAGAFDFASLARSCPFALAVWSPCALPAALPVLAFASFFLATSAFALCFCCGEPCCFLVASFAAAPFGFGCGFAFTLGCCGRIFPPPPPPPLGARGGAGAGLALPLWASASPFQNANVITNRPTAVTIDAFIAMLLSIRRGIRPLTLSADVSGVRLKGSVRIRYAV